MPNIKIGINSIYVEVYDYINEKFGWKKEWKGIPLIHQETDESLYIKDNKLNKKQLNKLSKIFVESLEETYKRFYGV